MSSEELQRGRLLLVDEDKNIQRQLIEYFCNFLLCGSCGLISKVDNGESVMISDIERADKEGRLRVLHTDIAKKGNEVRYLTRKWKESREGYENMVIASKELENLRSEAYKLSRSTAKPEFWCPFCTWKWPESYPFQIDQIQTQENEKHKENPIF